MKPKSGWAKESIEKHAVHRGEAWRQQLTALAIDEDDTFLWFDPEALALFKQANPPPIQTTKVGPCCFNEP